ncbi:putative bifunctional diguanylate cyclase/phosphodiesterase [Sphingomonas jatrophae]|uniref:Periplasmic sensor diguanylate cyclase/phosphodiesterase n=1 Tax=Sphingomonas jatrophae TaxID=1166337 RepID=A0A1I6JEU5_9SPHN|nr:EAL domain-containing protein [Sphingomonas jatrophae]SFR77491.1 periplasmic sensor diguanylate cyclase/phosphodiesterase [Sphingomonas jatrophae]
MTRTGNVPHADSAGQRYFLMIVLPAFGALAVVAALVAGLILLSAQEADRAAGERDRHVIASSLRQGIERTAHDQEGGTVWDDAVVNTRDPAANQLWIDMNVGVWMHTYFGHDQAYLIDPDDRPVYAMSGGHKRPVASFAEVSGVARPLIAQLRAKMRVGQRPPAGERSLTPGAIDLGLVAGHPAIVSVKPIVSDTGLIRQTPGKEPLHISVRYVDGSFLTDLARANSLEGARFLEQPPRDRALAAVPLRNARGTPLGYVAWRAFRPGASMVSRITPPMLLALALAIATLVAILRHVRRNRLALEASEAQAHHLAFHDTLTGLPNRARFDERLAAELSRVRSGAGSVALLCLDLDGFKNVNDTLGHPAGDELIRQVGARLSATMRGTDLVARLGGDEFSIVQTGNPSVVDTEILCMRIVEAISEPFDIAGSQVRVGVSIGVAIGPEQASEASELSRKADIALYEAKRQGKGRYLHFAEPMDLSIRRRSAIEAGLREALATEGQLEVYYQPLYSSRTRAMKGAEALVRWHHPSLGTVSPAIFVPIAESTNLIAPLGEWVMEEACRAAAAWPLRLLSVNVSAVQLRDPDFADKVFAILDRTGFDPHRLEVEVTETSFIENARHCRPNLQALRARGVKIALDDFGTGYSSLTHLQQFDVDRIKIDRSFVNAIQSADAGSPIIRAILDLADASGLDVTAEGVETQAQSEFLTQAGCDALQGYLLARPMPKEAIAALFADAAT